MWLKYLEQTFYRKDWIVNILGLAHNMVSTVTSQLCHSSSKVATDDILMNVCGYGPTKLYLPEQRAGLGP